MKTVPLILVIVIGVVVITLLSLTFREYLFTRIFTSSSSSTSSLTASPGERVRLNTSVTSTQSLSVHLCSKVQGCFPLAVNNNSLPRYVRIPIGYAKGPATFEITEHLSKKQLATIPIRIQ